FATCFAIGRGPAAAAFLRGVPGVLPASGRAGRAGLRAGVLRRAPGGSGCAGPVGGFLAMARLLLLGALVRARGGTNLGGGGGVLRNRQKCPGRRCMVGEDAGAP